jgi:amino acid transporter
MDEILMHSPQVCLGEMVAHLPVAGGHITLARRFVSPAFGFTLGWKCVLLLFLLPLRALTDALRSTSYWYNWTIVLPAELNAAAVLISYWVRILPLGLSSHRSLSLCSQDSSTNPGVYIAVTLVVAVAINWGSSPLLILSLDKGSTRQSHRRWFSRLR